MHIFYRILAQYTREDRTEISLCRIQMLPPRVAVYSRIIHTDTVFSDPLKWPITLPGWYSIPFKHPLTLDTMDGEDASNMIKFTLQILEDPRGKW